MSEDPIGIPRPRIRLKRPAAPGCTLKIVAAVVTVVALLYWLFSDSSGPPAEELAAGEGPAAVEAILTDATESISASAPSLPEPGNMERQARGETTATVSGVTVQFSVPPGWVLNEQPDQVFVRESSGTRLCQITGDAAFDLADYRSRVEGRETELESAYLRATLAAGVRSAAPPGADVGVDIEPDLVSSSYTADTMQYVVRARATLFIGMGRPRRYLRNVIANVAAGASMARIQCSNVSADEDLESRMESLAGSLRLVSM